jgi:hypothetical protein
MTLAHDDIRAAVAAGLIDERQAAGLVALADRRRGARALLDAREEPFELFRGFNEVFIVVGLTILYGGWAAVSGLLAFEMLGMEGLWAASVAALTLVILAALSRYFTLRRRMVAPSIALVVMFGLAAIQLGISLGWVAGFVFNIRFAFAAGLTTALLALHFAVFRVPFTAALIALGCFATAGAFLLVGGAEVPDVADLFRLSGRGPFAWLTILLGIVALAAALTFDLSDPHRVSLRSAAGFWLHVVAAPAIVNTVAVTLLDRETAASQAWLLLFLLVLATFAVAIDRRSFLVSGAAYVVVLAVVVLEDAAALAILALGAGLVLLGAQWERLRGTLMRALPEFPGKRRLPPWVETP